MIFKNTDLFRNGWKGIDQVTATFRISDSESKTIGIHELCIVQLVQQQHPSVRSKLGRRFHGNDDNILRLCSRGN